MAISVVCGCGKRMKADDKDAGKKARCPACGASVDIPHVPAFVPLINPDESSEVNLLRARVNKLEKANRRFMVATFVGFLFLFLSGLAVSTRSNPPLPTSAAFAQVFAQEFTLVDAQGETRAILESDNSPKSGPSLCFLNRGHKVIEIGCSDFNGDFAHITFKDAMDHRYVGLSMSKNSASLRLSASKEGYGVHLEDTSDASPYLQLNIPKSRAFAQLSLSDAVGPMIDLADKEGHVFYQMPKLKLEP